MTLVLLIKHIRHFTLITVSFVTVNILDLPIKLNWDLLHRCNCKYHVEQSCSSLVYGSFWCSSSSSYSHIMLKSVKYSSHASFPCMCNSTDLLQTYCFGQCPASSSRLWRAGCPSIVAHESKLQKASVDPAVRSGLWKNIQDQNCSDFTFRSRETRDTQQITHLSIVTGTPAEQTQPIYHQDSINHQSIINGWSEIRPLESRFHWLSSSPPCLWLCMKELRCVLSSPPALLHSSAFFCSSSSLSAVIVALSSSLRTDEASQTAVNLKLCVLSLRLKSNHIHFNHLNQHTSTHHIIQIQEKLRHPTYNRSRSRLLLVIYKHNKLESIILNITTS